MAPLEKVRGATSYLNVLSVLVLVAPLILRDATRTTTLDFCKGIVAPLDGCHNGHNPPGISRVVVAPLEGCHNGLDPPKMSRVLVALLAEGCKPEP